jgi:hypothetical protein
MSEHNYFALTVKAQMEKDPSVFEFDLKKFEEQQKKMLAARDARFADDNPPDPYTELRNEYNRLFNDHFNLKQWVRGCENRVNESAGQIRNIEERFNSLLEQKKTTESPLGKRNIENAMLRVEDEITAEKSKYNSLRTENVQAVKQLKAFDVVRLEALKTELDNQLNTPKVVSK